MPPKVPPKTTGAKSSSKPVPAGLDDPPRDIKRFLDLYIKGCTANRVEPIASLVRKVRDEYAAAVEVFEKGHVVAPIFPIVISDQLTFEGLKVLLDALLEYKFLHQISFWSVVIGDDGAMLLGDFLRNDTRCRTLELLSCNVGPKGCWHLGRALAVSSSLQYLVLDHNPGIGDEGAATLGDGLKWNSSIRHLSLNHCGLHDAAGEAIASFVIRSSSVATLLLRGNRIGPPGLTAIARALAHNVVITTLDLADNAFGADLAALECFADAIATTDALADLDISLNAIIPEGIIAIVEAVKTRPNLQAVKIPERCPAAVFESLLVALDANKKAQKALLKKASAKPAKTADPAISL